MMRTVCLILILCGPSTWRAMSAGVYAVSALDAKLTYNNCAHACVEYNPMARPMVYAGHWQYPAYVAAESVAVNLAAYRLRKSKGWLRRVALVPQISSMLGHGLGISVSIGNLH